MACLTFQSCCCMSLRQGSFVVAFICMVFEAISLIVNSIIARFISTQGIEQQQTSYIYAQKFMIFLSILIVCFKIWLCVVLLIGLFKRLPDHLQMWYMGFLLSVLMQTAITVCATVKEYDAKSVMFWLLVAERIILTVITLFFVMIVRSYFFKMCKEPNYYQNIAYANQAAINENGVYNDKPTSNDPDEDTLFIAPAKGRNSQAPKNGFLKKGGGVVYSTPQENTPMDMPAPFQHNEIQSSMLYPSLV